MLVYTRIELDYIVKHAMMQCNEHDIVEHSRYSVCMYVCIDTYMKRWNIQYVMYNIDCVRHSTEYMT